MSRLFGTDGIRGVANSHPITPETGLGLGRAVIHLCERNGFDPSVVIGGDTRASGKMLEYAVASGVLSASGKVRLAGEIPTPGVAYLTRALGCGAGIVISASHNSYEYNGFKVFSSKGYKLSEQEESGLEELILSAKGFCSSRVPEASGDVSILSDAASRYISFLGKTLRGVALNGIRVVLDCANGAASTVGPALFQGLGIEADLLCAEPDGRNINRNCGSQHTKALRQRVLETGADVGLAFDGDADRLIAVDEKGKVLTGDQILVVCAKMLKDQGGLKNNLVVSTVMSNIGLSIALERLGIEQVSTRVGDRHVMEEMRARHAALGGEESGHIIFRDHHTTGDGLVSALQLLAAIKLSGRPLSELSGLMTIFPQTLINIRVSRKPELSTVPELAEAVSRVEKKLGDRGRVLVRYSGTEPVLRVMVEGEDRVAVEGYASLIGEVVKRKLSYSNSSDSSAG